MITQHKAGYAFCADQELPRILAGNILVTGVFLINPFEAGRWLNSATTPTLYLLTLRPFSHNISGLLVSALPSVWYRFVRCLCRNFVAAIAVHPFSVL